MYETPPILRGSAEAQLAALRGYLLRLTRTLEARDAAAITAPGAAAAATAAATTTATPAAATATPAPAADALPAGYGRLRSLVLRTADSFRRDLDVLERTLRAETVAVSDFGVYREQIALQMAATARQIVESYDFLARLDALDGELDALDGAVLSLQGQIRRGLITDPETGEEELGIAIGQQLRFTGATRTEDGLEYQELAPGQTLGLYTSHGWQFWINGTKQGWFDAVDGMLHVRRLSAEALQLGAGWLLTADGGFGLRAV